MLFGLVLILLGYNIYRWYSREQDAKVQKAWAELADASESENPPFTFNAIAAQSDVRPVQALAYLGIGDYYLNCLNLGGPLLKPANMSYTPELADREAEKAYQKILADFPDQSLAVARAHLGLARLYEDRHDWDNARKQYEIVAAKSGPFAGTPFAAVAQDRLDHVAQWAQPVTFAPPAVIPATAPSSRPADSLRLDNSLPAGPLDLSPSFLPGSSSLSPLPGGGFALPSTVPPPPSTAPSH